MNTYAQAIYNITHHPQRLIADTINGIERGIVPLEPPLPGSMAWDVYIIYRSIREYEQLLSKLQRSAN